MSVGVATGRPRSLESADTVSNCEPEAILLVDLKLLTLLNNSFTFRRLRPSSKIKTF